MQNTGANASTWTLSFLRESREVLSGAFPIVVLLSLVGAVIAVQPAFFSMYGLRVILGESSAILLLATGQTLVIIIAGIDLSIAAMASLASLVLALAGAYPAEFLMTEYLPFFLLLLPVYLGFLGVPMPPAIDLIDFDYPPFHTVRDDLSAVSARSLDATGETLVVLLRRLRAETCRTR